MGADKTMCPTCAVLPEKRAEATRSNMLVGLAVLESLLIAGVGQQDAMRFTSKVGGPFCNLLGFLVARLAIESPVKALETVRAHVPDPTDVDMQLFLRDVSDYYVNSRPLLERNISPANIRAPQYSGVH